MAIDYICDRCGSKARDLFETRFTEGVPDSWASINLEITTGGRTRTLIGCICSTCLGRITNLSDREREFMVKLNPPESERVEKARRTLIDRFINVVEITPLK